MESPEVRYARSGAVNIAYQVIGDGPVDLLYIPGRARAPRLGETLPSYRMWLRSAGAWGLGANASGTSAASVAAPPRTKRER